jgi:hypothetical protein
MNGEKEKAETTLTGVCAERTDPVLTLLSVYLLHSIKPAPERLPLVEQGRQRLKEKYTEGQWAREIEKSKSSVQVVILQKLIEEATDWLFAKDGEAKEDNPVIH